MTKNNFIQDVETLDNIFEKLFGLASKFKIKIDYGDNDHYSWSIEVIAHDIAHNIVNDKEYKETMDLWSCRLCPFNVQKKFFNKKDRLIYSKDIMKTEELVLLVEDYLLEKAGFDFPLGHPSIHFYNDENIKMLNDMKILDGKKLIIPQ